MFNNIYKNKRVLITGHSGFKGSWLTLWLKSLGANILGYSLEPDTNPSMFKELKIHNDCQNVFANILDEKELNKTFEEFQPEIVFHLAAQPLVRLSYSKPKLTYETNIIGTLNVLEAARNCNSTKAFVNVTTDKCYENKEQHYYYKESDALGGHDMYSSSKGCAEILSSSYRRSFLGEENSFALATARAGNVIGGGDWAEDRLIPDCIKSINNNEKIEIRNPLAIRPWQFVLEPLSGYLLLGQKLLEQNKKYADCFNFGPSENSLLNVEEIAKKIIKYYGHGEISINKKDDLHEANLLMLNIEKSKKYLSWEPTLDTEEAIKDTVEWYKHFYLKDVDIYNFTLSQIKNFEGKIKWS